MDPRFHAAQAALVAGDAEGLSSLLDEDPSLATARSQVSHPTLLQCLVLTMPPVENLESLIDFLASRGAELTDPLIAASGMDNVRAMGKLLDLGADIEGNGRWSPLEEVLYFGNGTALTLLIGRGATPRNLRGAAGLGDMEYIARCFGPEGGLTSVAGEVAWPFNSPISEDVRRDRQQIIDNALVYAGSWGHAEAVDELLLRGARVNSLPAGFDYTGTALHYAALCGRRVMVDHLLRVGADPGIRDTKIGKLPEDWADHGGHKELADHLQRVRSSAA